MRVLLGGGGELVRDLARAGIGVALLPDFFVADDLARGGLVELLEREVGMFNAGVFLVYPQTRHLSPAVRAFIDYVVEHGIERPGQGAE